MSYIAYAAAVRSAAQCVTGCPERKAHRVVRHLQLSVAAQCVTIALLCLASVSCSREESRPYTTPVESTLPMVVAPCGEGESDITRGSLMHSGGLTRGSSLTRATASSDASSDAEPLEDRYSIYMSAYYEYPEAPVNEGNYFTCVPFTHNASGIWSANPAKYWPIGGSMSFLALALDPTALERTDDEVCELIQWTERHNTDGVRIEIPDYDGSSEILYASVSKYSNDGGPLPMLFHRTQACLEFNIRISDEALDGLIRLEGIDVDAIMTGGVLTVMTYPFREMSWNTDDSEAKNLTVPKSKGDNDHPIEITSEPLTFRLPLVPQRQRIFHIHFRQRANTGIDWNERSVTMTYDHNDIDNKWEIGKKYVYNITIGIHAITVIPEVEPWSADISDVYM